MLTHHILQAMTRHQNAFQLSRSELDLADVHVGVAWLVYWCTAQQGGGLVRGRVYAALLGRWSVTAARSG